MPKTDITKTKTKKYRDIDDILRDPTLRMKFTNLVDEAVRCKGAIASQQETIKSLREVAMNELGLLPRLFNVAVSTNYNNDFTERKETLEQQVSLIENMMGLPAPDSSDDE